MAGRARLTPQLTAARINHLGALISLRHMLCLICYGRAMAYAVDDVALPLLLLPACCGCGARRANRARSHSALLLLLLLRPRSPLRALR